MKEMEGKVTLREYIKMLEKEAPERLDLEAFLLVAKNDETHTTGIAGGGSDIAELFHYMALHILETVEKDMGKEAATVMASVLKHSLDVAIRDVVGGDDEKSELFEGLFKLADLAKVLEKEKEDN